MDRLTDIVLRLSLLLSALGSLLSLVKMVLEHFMPMSYYWWAAVAFFGATIALASAVRLRDNHAPATRQHLHRDDAVQN